MSEHLDRLTSAIQDAVGIEQAEQGLVVTRWVTLLEYMDTDGDRTIMRLMDPDMTTQWDADGLAWNQLKDNGDEE